MHGLKAKEVSGSPPPRIVIGRLLSAAAEDQVPLCQRTQSKALRHLADAHKSPQCDEELSRERHNHDLAHGPAGILGSGPIPFDQGAVLLEQQHAPRQLDHALTHP